MPDKLSKLDGISTYVFDPNNSSWGFEVPNTEVAEKILEWWNKDE